MPSAPAAPGTPAPGEEDKEETITLKRSDLGTYAAKNRPLKEAILELKKGKQEADDIITYNKEKRIPAMEKLGQTLVLENQRLSNEVTQLRAKVAPAAPAAPAPVDVPAAPNVDDFDMFDPDQKKKYQDALAAHETGLTKKHQAEIDALRNPPPPPASPAPAPAGTLPPAVVREYEEVDLFQANPETRGLFKTDKPVADVEKDYLSFVGNIARLKGITTIYDAAGRFMPDVSKHINDYFNPETPAGKALRTETEAAHIAPVNPKDLQTLFRIYDVRRVRMEHQRENPVTHVVEPISYDQAFDTDRRLHPEKYAASPAAPAAPGAAPAAPGQPGAPAAPSALERGIQQRQQYAPEVPATSAVPIQEHQTTSVDEFFRLMRKPIDTYTPEEVTRLRSLMKSEAKMADDEIDAWFKRPSPK